MQGLCANAAIPSSWMAVKFFMAETPEVKDRKKWM